jgi:hypothetical protein
MPTKKSAIKVYVSEEEHARIRELADSAALSLSAFTRQVCLGYEMMGRETRKTRHELRRLKGDIGRIGGLLKQSLARGAADKHHVYRLLGELDARQREITAAVERLS